MTIECPAANQAAATIAIADSLPEDVRDSGKVRIGAGVHLCWLSWEIMRYLPGLMRFWPDTGC